ncbi:KpsF/GutQ family sugar-phosphate isomerase [Kingella kingae]|nr:KpsF/GutQ family sugar-phosphate isomerase [Kingella kingae]MDK4623745.1 KpsF/GutQ family sugar-phosphate isomerase [Kingella kingae]MDK4652894.1 KpsF/GutQ family sugar-phosphate isomerase [Kingella kingae]MDK4659453.1 KpsF/GutQ family sugar-phosphate isomerase [Kingella kingae]MDK4667279.1 KpsF/GutQ family sugar-phosphate isomerase [Kingella kingae]MDK4685767.1 KpsF/GutQ family sugar-phosphate isomerase [Kingella kingae]
MNMNHQYLTWAQQALSIEAQSIAEISQNLGDDFVQAALAILNCTGRTIVMGMGKSGHIGRKIAATLASTGTPAFFVHPAEAAHGDLGMILDNDVVLALSNSGESDEILAILPALKRKHTTLICITSNRQSSMARYADIHIQAKVSQEACPLGLAPTSSTTAVLALGDALAIVLLKARQFTPEDFALSHPAGNLGRRLLLTVRDVMHQGDALPAVLQHTPLRDAILTMSEKGLGMVGIIDEQSSLHGVFTDGDLRRLFAQHERVGIFTIDEVMKTQPCTISPDKLASEALKLMQDKRINGLLVCEHGKLVGALNMYDLLKARVI